MLAGLITAAFACSLPALQSAGTWDGGGGGGEFSLNTNWVGDTTPATPYDGIVMSGNLGTNVTFASPATFTQAATGTAAMAFDATTTGSFTLSGSLLTINGFVGSTATLKNASGLTQTINNNLRWTANNPTITSTGSGSVLNLNGGIQVDSFVTLSTGSNGILKSNGAISGGGLALNGNSGVIELNGINTYTGLTTVFNNTVKVSHDALNSVSGSLGNASSSVTLGINSGTSESPTLLTAGAVTIARNISLAAGTAIKTLGGSTANISTFSGTINMGSATTGSNLTMTAAAGGQVNFTGNFTPTSAGADTVTKIGAGLVVLSGTNTYTGASIVNEGTLNIGNGTSGTLNGATGTALTFGSKGGTVNFNQAAGTTQGMGTLTFGGIGNNNVQSTYGGSGNTSVTFASLAARSAGATANFVVSGGTNGTTNKIILTGVTSGALIDAGIFFNGSSYAAANVGSGYVRGLIYGTDSGTQTSAGAASLSSGSGSNAQITGNVTAQTTATFTTLNISGNNNFSLAAAQTVGFGGILKTGNTAGGSTISGGTAIQASTAGGELVIRTDGANDALTISSVIANNTSASSLTKTGAGTLTLSGANTFTGPISVNEGTLKAGRLTTAFGPNTQKITMANSSGTTLDITGFNTDIGSLAGGGDLGGNVILGAANLTFRGVDNTTYAGVISGTGQVRRFSSGILTLTGGNTYSGLTDIGSGSTLNIQNNTATGTTAGGVNVQSGGALQVQGGITVGTEALTLNGLGVSNAGALRNVSGNNEWQGLVTLAGTARINSDAGTLALSNVGTITGATFGLTVGGAGNTSIAGVIGTTTGTLSKDGVGRLTLSGANSYTGATTVAAGTLLVNGSLAAGSAVTVQNGGTLGGNGTIIGSVTVQSGGTLSPGNSPGLLTVGSLVLNGGSTTAFEIVGAASRGTDFDAITIIASGGLTLNGAFTINFMAPLNDTTNINLFSFAGGHTGDFSSLVSTGSYAGTWTRDIPNDAWTLTSGSQTLTFSEGSGNLNVVPEPTTWALLAFSLTTILVLRRRDARRES